MELYGVGSWILGYARLAVFVVPESYTSHSDEDVSYLPRSSRLKACRDELAPRSDYAGEQQAVAIDAARIRELHYHGHGLVGCRILTGDHTVNVLVVFDLELGECGRNLVYRSLEWLDP